jgi:hypothetical protein
MNDQNYPVTRQGDTFRIMLLGDSFVENLHIREVQTHQHVLEDRLNTLVSPALKIEVIAAGIGGWGPAQELLYFRSIGQAYRPDLLLIQWYPGNDLVDNMPNRAPTYQGVPCYSPYLVICDGQFDPEPWYIAPGLSPTLKSCSRSRKIMTSALNYLYLHSRLYQRLDLALVESHYQSLLSLPDPWLGSDGPNHEMLDYSYQLTDATYGRLIDEAREAGVRTAFVIAPVKQAVYADANITNRDLLLAVSQFPALKGVNPRLPNETFFKIMTHRGLPILDLHPAFVEYLHRQEEPSFREGDVHWNVTGNRIAAGFIADWLIEQKLVPLTP